MTRAALTKLLILVILAFIICLPEFFTLYRASKVNFLCLPYRPCERGRQVKKGENGRLSDAGIRKMGMCDPSQTPQREMWEQACTQEGQNHTTDPLSDSTRRSEDKDQSWFMCETNVDIARLHKNISSSALKEHFEVSVEIQLRGAETLNLTLYGLNNHSSLHLHPSEEEEEDKNKADEGQLKAFYCCLPAPPTLETANQSYCLLWLANQTVSTATAKEKLPWKRTQKDEWLCVIRVVWLALLCVVLLAIVTIVLGQISRGKCSPKKPKAHPGGYNFSGHQLTGNERQNTEIIIPKGLTSHSNGSHPWLGTELSPIQEVDTQDEIETLLDGNVENSYTANLYHRSHPSASSLTEEQAW